MNAPDSKPHCEVLHQLQEELHALSRALRRANEILILPAESPDTLRRRRNSIKRWNEIYSIAYERVMTHQREHQCHTEPAAE